MEIGILEHDNFSPKAIKTLSSLGQVRLYDGNQSISDFVADLDILFIRLKYFINEDILASATKLKYICSPTTGFNHVDMNYLTNKGIKYISLKGETDFLRTIRATPEHTFGLILALFRNYKNALLDANNSCWDRDKYIGKEIFQTKFGIIGYGRVGKLLSSYLNAFDGKVMCYDIKSFEENETVIKCNSINDLITASEVIILCADYRGQFIINRPLLELMKNKFFINTARGELVDEDLLIKLIEKKWFAGVALDVISNESQTRNNKHKLLSLSSQRNLIITPHIAGATHNSMYRTEEFVADKLKQHLL